MPIDQTTNILLKEMWRIAEKLDRKEALSEGEEIFYSAHIVRVREYYEDRAKEWKYKHILWVNHLVINRLST